MNTLWSSPTDFVTGDSSLVISYPAGMPPALEITTTAPGDDKWIYLALKVPPSHEINALQVCYQLSNVGSFIAQIQLVEMQTPDVTAVNHDDSPGQGQLTTAPTNYRSEVDAYRPAGAVLLALRLHFADPNHTITLGGMGVEVTEWVTWDPSNPGLWRPELGPIAANPGKPLRADSGFVHYGGKSLDWDFHTNPYTAKAWDATRSTIAAWRILSNYFYPPYPDSKIESRHNARFLPYNPAGTYAQQLSIVRTSKSSAPVEYAKWVGLMYADALVIPEELFVHFGGGSDEAARVKRTDKPHVFLMKFDDEKFFDQFIAPLIDNFYRNYPYATGAPAIFVDNCPGYREFWCGIGAGWDHFATDAEWFAGWQQVLRRIKSKYPNLKIMANWIPQNPDEGADRVLELVDHILFENFFGDRFLKFYLAYGYRAQKLGKGVTFGSSIIKDKDNEPTLDDYSRAYFCAFLLTWGENSHWGGQWHLPDNSGGKIHDLALFQKWFGVPAAGENGTDMWEIRPDLWTRNFVNAKVFLNVSEYHTYTIPLSEALDETGKPVSWIKLGPFQGQFVFRQGAPTSGFPSNAPYWRQLPNLWRGYQSYPYSLSCDAIVSSLNLGMGESNANWVTDSEDLTAATWLRHGSTTVTKVDSWNGIPMNEVANLDPGDPLSALVVHSIQYGSALAKQYLTLICYAQQVDETIQGLGFVLDNTGIYQFFPLKQGAYPKLIVSVIQVPDTFVGDHCTIGLWGVPTTAKGSFRVGAVRVMISSSEPDQLTFGEYIRTIGATLTRASGAGIGLPLHLVGLSGYLPANSRPQLPLLNRTQIVGLASGSGSSAERALLQDVDVGYQYFDTTLGMPLWWKGNSWITGDGTVVP